MTLDEVIKHCEELVDDYICTPIDFIPTEEAADRCKCAIEHHQLAEWLKELKAYREKDHRIIGDIKAVIESEINDISFDVGEKERLINGGIHDGLLLALEIIDKRVEGDVEG